MIYLIGVTHPVQDYNSVRSFGPKYKNIPCLIKEFKSLVVDVIKTHDIKVIAEEYNKSFLKGEHDHSVLDDIAQSFNPPLRHFYCDPDEEERKNIGIPSDSLIEKQVLGQFGFPYRTFLEYQDGSDFDFQECRKLEENIQLRIRSYWPLREKFWLDKVGNYIYDNILFAIGAFHIPSFSELIQSNCLKSVIIEKDFVGDRLSGDDSSNTKKCEVKK